MNEGSVDNLTLLRDITFELAAPFGEVRIEAGRLKVNTLSVPPQLTLNVNVKEQSCMHLRDLKPMRISMQWSFSCRIISMFGSEAR